MKILAYIDPGTMSFILQVVLGGIAALWMTIKLFGRRIMTFLGLSKKTTDEAQQ